VHDGDDRFSEFVDEPVKGRKAPGIGPVRFEVVGGNALEIFEVGARAKSGTFPSENDDFHRRVPGGSRECRGQFLHHHVVERIPFLGTPERDRCTPSHARV
jgi:hypothetical protein